MTATPDYTQVKTVGIIGAGVAGLVTARVLIAEGLDCTLYERGPVLGGVWAAGYSNFGVQVQKELYEYPDWPLPEGTEDFTPGPVIQKYLEDYAGNFGITPCIRFDTDVVMIGQGMYGKELFSVHARFEDDSDRISSSEDQGLRGYTEKI
jgi:dimethylaniline monooxygenase (N-oxide forming)